MHVIGPALREYPPEWEWLDYVDLTGSERHTGKHCTVETYRAGAENHHTVSRTNPCILARNECDGSWLEAR